MHNLKKKCTQIAQKLKVNKIEKIKVFRSSFKNERKIKQNIKPQPHWNQVLPPNYIFYLIQNLNNLNSSLK